MTCDLILEFQRARREPEDFSVFRVQQKNNTIGRRRQRHLCEMGLCKEIDVLMRREGILKINGVNASSRCFYDAAEGTGGKMPVSMKEIKVITTYGYVNGVINGVWDLITEVKVGRIQKSAIFADKDPDRASRGIQHI